MSLKERVAFSIKHPVRTLDIVREKIFPRVVKQNCNEENLKRRFDDFRNNYIVSSSQIFTSYDELKRNYPMADFYIVGSDQIWNIDNEYDTNRLNAWFLNFLPENILRYSYAASFGRQKLPLAVRKVMKRRLKKFSLVTLRENAGADICDKMGIQSCIVCDPTLLLPKQKYRDLFTGLHFPKEKYIFLYLLSNDCNFRVNKLNKWAVENSLKLVYVTGNSGWKTCDYDDAGIEKNNLTINEWLGYLIGAEFVITNSFHCTLFSLLFEKKIAVVPLSGNLKTTNNRIDSLYSNLKVQKNVVEKNNFSSLLTIEPQKIDESFVEKSKEILNSFGGGL